MQVILITTWLKRKRQKKLKFEENTRDDFSLDVLFDNESNKWKDSTIMMWFAYFAIHFNLNMVEKKSGYVA